VDLRSAALAKEFFVKLFFLDAAATAYPSEALPASADF